MNISIKQNGWIRIAVKIAVLALSLWIIFGLCFGLHRMNGVGMAHRIEDGDLVLYSRLVDAYAADDPVLFEYDGEVYLSSILALPGDLIEIDERGCLRVNGVQVSDDIVYNLEQDETPDFSTPYLVPNGSYFVLNENLESMEDSRSFGAIWAKDIKGKVVGILRTRSV